MLLAPRKSSPGRNNFAHYNFVSMAIVSSDDFKKVPGIEFNRTQEEDHCPHHQAGPGGEK